jgi:septal ring factor EnvC (AmiA/AmiB activator)
MHGLPDGVIFSSNVQERHWWRRAWERAVKFNPEVDLGQLAVVATLIGGVALWAINSRDAAVHASDAVNGLRSDVASLRADTNEQFKAVRADIANLPDVRAQLVQMERRLDQNDSRADAQSKRLELLEREVIQSRADLDNVIRASQPPAKH